MKLTRSGWLLWTPRVLAILFTVFVSMFALDVFVEGRPWREILVALWIHLIPAYLLIGVLALAWRRPWIGAAGFAVLAAAYSAMAWRHPGWILAVALPLLGIAGLFWLSWRAQPPRQTER